MMLLSEAAGVMQGILHGDDQRFDTVHTDTRTLSPGALFFALQGANFDGQAFLEVAQQAGAVAAVVQSFNDQIKLPQIVVSNAVLALGDLAKSWRQRFAGVVIGLTGSSGKTTVKGFLKTIIEQFASVHATPGNWNNHIGVPLTLFGLQSQRFAVIELGTSNPGEISYLTDLLRPDIALVNNIGPAHLAGFGSLDAIAREKSAIYALLTPEQTAVINLDDAYAPVLLQQTDFCRQMGFGGDGSAELESAAWASDIHFDESGCGGFTLNFDGQSFAVKLRVLGRHNINNALAAAATASAAGVPISAIVAGLTVFGGDPGRMQIVAGSNGTRLIDDTYNANPKSVFAAIDQLRSYKDTRILVFGDMGELGDASEASHVEVGAYASEQNIDFLFCVGAQAALAAARFGNRGYAYADQRALVNGLQAHLNAHTTILIKGSRSAYMENVVQALCEEDSVRC